MKEMGKIAIIAKYGELNLTSLLKALFLMMTYGGWGEFLETESRIPASYHLDASYGAKWVDLSVQFCEGPL
jgi:hypothetical protein